jgi:hypothetical protein
VNVAITLYGPFPIVTPDLGPLQTVNPGVRAKAAEDVALEALRKHETVPEHVGLVE